MKRPKTLLLSNAFEPIDVIGYRRVLTLLFTDKAEVVYEYPDQHIRSPSTQVPLPSVIRYKYGSKYRRRHVKLTKTNIYIRDNGICQYCDKKLGKNNYTIDHVIPKSKFKVGEQHNSWENLVLCCGPCNRRKADMLAEEAGMVLKRKPHAPKYLSEYLKIVQYSDKVPDEWGQFFFVE